MKKLLFSLATAGTLLLSGCDRKAETTTTTTATEPAATTATVTSSDSTRVATQAAAYICPMKCEGSASDKPGKCPTCGMDLVKNS